MKKMWVSPYWVSSWRNFTAKRIRKFSYPRKVEFCDMTLESDGEDMPGISFEREEKMRIAKALDEIGVQRIAVRAGFGKGIKPPSDREIDDYRAISRMGLSARIFAFCGTVKEEIDRALSYDVPGVVIQNSCSEELMKATGSERAQVLNDAVESIDYARDHGLNVAYMPMDTTRARKDFLRRLLTAVRTKTKADSIVVSDSVGCASPFGIFNLVEEVRRLIHVPIELHCHNDFGMSTANSFSGIAAGATIIHTTVNGMGERAGLVALEEIATALKVLRGIETGIRFEKLVELSKFVGSLSNYPARRNKPIVGELAMAVEVESAVLSAINLKKANYLQGDLPFLPEFVGNKFRVVLGAKTEDSGVRWALQEGGLSCPEEKIPQLVENVKLLARKVKRPISDDEFREMVGQALQGEG